MILREDGGRFARQYWSDIRPGAPPRRLTYCVRITRTDQPGIDPVYIRADSRTDAEDFCRQMFGERLIRIVNSPGKRKRRKDRR